MNEEANTPRARRIIEYKSLVVAYAMSRLDERFLAEWGFPTWKAAFERFGSALNVRPASFKNLRDEFDPVHNNSRRGWANRPMRRARARVVSDFSEISDEGLTEIVRGILAGDSTVTNEVVRPLITSHDRVANVAMRLRTGRLAEDYFLGQSERICGIPTVDIQDKRNDAQGFDFGVSSRPSLQIEVKGLTSEAGEIVFTDLEWKTAQRSGDQYWLVVVGRLPSRPKAKLHVDPYRLLRIKPRIERCVRLSWRSRVSVA
jgi:hypothetical protein